LLKSKNMLEKDADDFEKYKEANKKAVNEVYHDGPFMRVTAKI